MYVQVNVTHSFAEQGVPLSWPDVHLPHEWHLNQARVQVPAIPRAGHGRRRDILRRHAFLLADLRQDPAYTFDSPVWDQWSEAEHDMCRQSIEAHLEAIDNDEVDYEERRSGRQRWRGTGEAVG
jgi:hypothetical protein